ncbi:MAG: hypothetical protein JOZ46_02495 [Candidatus Dormibacteraeota bacterium]|nr:hypothetical protein [Candidatus Dormibacteraeota bacterium]MBV9524667.1 hypothetical protein [Candidatus Dormibacteraeota bacterium]
MVLRRAASRTLDTGPPRHGVGPWLKRWTIPIIGAVTPVGLIVVNISIFIAKHLTEFRWTIAILAFVSGVMLNSWAGLNIYRVLQRRRPDHALVKEHNQEVVLVGGMAVIIAAAFLTALFCYLGLSSEKDLPSGLTFVTGIVAIAVPILLQFLFRRTVRTRRARPTSSAYSPGMPPTGPPVAQPPGPPSVGDAVRRP